MPASSIPWSDNPRDYLRAYPAWYALYRTLSQERLSPAELAKLLGVSEEYVRERQGIGKLLHRDKTAYSLFDAIIAAFVVEYRDVPAQVEFWERMLHDYDGMLWHALIGIVQGVKIYIEGDFDTTIISPYFHSGPMQEPDEWMFPTELNRIFRKVLVDVAWRDFSVEIDDAGRWAFNYAERGYLALEPLPLDADERDLRKEAVAANSKEERDEHGYKRLTFDNYMRVDPIFHHVVWWSQDPSRREERLKERIEDVLSIRMHPAVPIEVRKMFDTLKGAMVYGYFYRPLFAVVRNQAYIVADAATWYRCKVLGVEPPSTFALRVDLLKKQGIIPTDEGFLWDLARKFRNDAAHMTEQSMLWPASEVGSLERVADDINRLFIPIFSSKRPSYLIVEPNA